MNYNHPFRRVFDLDSAFNERASPRSTLFSDLYGLFDMNQFPQSRISKRNAYNINNVGSKFNRYDDDEMTTATLIPVVHLPSTNSPDCSTSSQKSTSYSDSTKSGSSFTKKGSEAEVDALTNILIKSMGNTGKESIHNTQTLPSTATQPYSNRRIPNTTVVANQQTRPAFTTGSLSRQSSLSSNECFRCRKQFDTTPNNSRISASPINGPLNTYFHQTCFSCYRCDANLNIDSFFYAQKRLLCSRCVHESLEKCTVCDFIINDRVIRVLGQPYHPKCFTCTICNCCLDGKAFTVDVHERMFCLEDFHKRYAPRCDACGEPICPQSGNQENKRIISADKTFHLQCFGVHEKK